jgi:hypothetical protein
MPSHGVGRVLGNGHAVIDNENFRGRPVAKWIPPYGEAAKPVIDALRAELVERLGEARARRIADCAGSVATIRKRGWFAFVPIAASPRSVPFPIGPRNALLCGPFAKSVMNITFAICR